MQTFEQKHNRFMIASQNHDQARAAFLKAVEIHQLCSKLYYLSQSEKDRQRLEQADEESNQASEAVDKAIDALTQAMDDLF